MDLSPRERQVLSLVTKGQTNAEIAASLGLAFDTVKWHVSGVLSKLGVDSREEAAAYWRDYNSFGGRLGRRWNAVIGVFASKTAAIAGASMAVVAAAAIAAVAIALSLNGGDSRDTASIDAGPTAPRVGVPSQLPAAAAMPLVRAGNTIFIPTSQGLAFFDATTRASQLVPGTTRGPLGSSSTGQVWTKGSGQTTLVQVDPDTRAISRTIDLPFPIDDTTFVYADTTAIYVSFWSYDALVKISAATGAVESTTTLNRPKGATLAGGFLWVALARSDSVARLHPDTMETLGEIPLGTSKESPGCGGCVSWVYSAGDTVYAISTAPGQVTKIEAATGKVIGTSLLPGKLLPGFAAASDGDAWLAVTPPGTLHGELVRLDSDTLQEVERVALATGRPMLEGVSPAGISELNGTIWVSTEQGQLIPIRATP